MSRHMPPCRCGNAITLLWKSGNGKECFVYCPICGRLGPTVDGEDAAGYRARRKLAMKLWNARHWRAS